jgi:uncharacterized protein (DUF427 family)
MHIEAVEPGQESVWDYPRPPRLEGTDKHIQVVFNGVTIADTRRAKRVLEMSHPPVYYIPPEDVQESALLPTPRTTFCEWKGHASYFTVQVGDKVAHNAVWSYPEPIPGFEGIAGYLAFYPAPMDECLVDGERVEPQPGRYYGGWVTRDIKGPFKGEPGSHDW